MDDLISRKALIAEYDRVHVGPPGGARKLIEDAPEVPPKVVAEIKIDNDALQRMVREAVEQIKAEQSDPDVVKVVRCKDCAWWQKEWSDERDYHYCTMEDDRTYKEFYCANAERREE